jgi:hypothetical protein
MTALVAGTTAAARIGATVRRGVMASAVIGATAAP